MSDEEVDFLKLGTIGRYEILTAYLDSAPQGQTVLEWQGPGEPDFSNGRYVHNYNPGPGLYVRNLITGDLSLIREDADFVYLTANGHLIIVDHPNEVVVRTVREISGPTQTSPAIFEYSDHDLTHKFYDFNLASGVTTYIGESDVRAGFHQFNIESSRIGNTYFDVTDFSYTFDVNTAPWVRYTFGGNGEFNFEGVRYTYLLPDAIIPADSLYDNLGNRVDFNELDSVQESFLSAGPALYNALNGNDRIWLPSIEKSTFLNSTSGETITWDSQAVFQGGDGNDQIVGNNRNDLIDGGAGNDLIEGGRGDDKIAGGQGIDAAVYLSNFANYEFSRGLGTSIIVRDQSVVTGYGSDTIDGIEQLQFSDFTYDFLGAKKGASAATSILGAVNETSTIATLIATGVLDAESGAAKAAGAWLRGSSLANSALGIVVENGLQIAVATASFEQRLRAAQLMDASTPAAQSLRQTEIEKAALAFNITAANLAAKIAFVGLASTAIPGTAAYAGVATSAVVFSALLTAPVGVAASAVVITAIAPWIIPVTAAFALGAAVSYGYDLVLKQPLEAAIASKFGVVLDGYLSGATVFSDENQNGILDVGEQFATTDSSGRFQLDSLESLVAFGGVDITTNLPFSGKLTAPAGFRIVSPVTTLIDAVEAQGGTSAQQRVLDALGIDNAIDVAQTDPLAGALAGDAGSYATLVAGIKVFNVVTLLQSALELAGADPAASHEAIFFALATVAIDGELSLNDPAFLTSVVNAAAESLGVTTDRASVNEINSIIGAINAAIDGAAASGAAVEQIDEILSLQFVAQGLAVQAIKDGAKDGKVSGLAEQFTGQHLQDLANLAPAGMSNSGENHTPIAVGSAATVLMNQQITGALIALDTDEDSLEFVITRQPEHGNLTVAGSQYTYVAASGFVGSDNFEFAAYDGSSTSNSVAVNLQVLPQQLLPHAPVGSPIELAAIREDSGPRTITAAELLAGVTDADGDAVTITALTLTSGNGTLVDNGDGTWSYTPTPNDATAASFSYSATDGSETATSTATLDITPVNDAPSGSDSTFTTNEDTYIRLSISDIGIEDTVDGAGNRIVAIKITSLPEFGQLTLDGPPAYVGMIITASDLEGEGLVFVPGPNASGSNYASFTYQAIDNGGTADGGIDLDPTPSTVFINVLPVNDVLDASPVTLTAIAEDNGTRTIRATELLAGVSDIDGDALSITSLTLTSGQGALVENGNDTWSYMPAANDDTSAAFSYAATDGTDTVTSTAVLDITPVNDAPSLGISTQITSVAENVKDTGVILTIADVDSLLSSANITLSGPDAALFQLVPVGNAAGSYRIEFINPPNFESPGDSDGNNLYLFGVYLSDGTTMALPQPIQITVTDNAEGPIVGSNNSETLSGTAIADLIYGRKGNDILLGFAGDDQLFGEEGNDTLDGGLGKDTMTGGTGDDVFIIDNGSDKIIERSREGTDTVRTALAAFSLAAIGNLENLTFTGVGSFSGTGNAEANVITGGSSNDTLDGGRGVDRLVGAGGDDLYYVDSALDFVVEQANGGSDTVLSTAQVYILAANVENLAYTGTGNFVGGGNALANIIEGGDKADIIDGGAGDDIISGGNGNDLLSGGAGNDILQGDFGNDTLLGGVGNDSLIGGLGNDTMSGGAGNDTYYVDTSGDRVIEFANEGVDTVATSLTSFTLGANVENVSYSGNASFFGTGNSLNNIISGDFGNDTLTGGAGNDRLMGGGGSDALYGGTGNDTFVFNPGFGNDTIIGFDDTTSVNDTITFSNSLFADFAAVSAATRQVGADVTITASPTDKLTIKGIAINKIGADDFSFA